MFYSILLHINIHEDGEFMEGIRMNINRLITRLQLVLCECTKGGFCDQGHEGFLASQVNLTTRR
jgi:hypothetical protein